MVNYLHYRIFKYCTIFGRLLDRVLEVDDVLDAGRVGEDPPELGQQLVARDDRLYLQLALVSNS